MRGALFVSGLVDRAILSLRLTALGVGLLFVFTVAAHAVQPDEILDDPVLEERARALSAELRCLVCQNQSIDDANAPLARDLRLLVRERLVAGDTDEDVMSFVVARYGEYVLLRPPFHWHTMLLCLGPPLLLLLGGGLLWREQQRQRLASAAASASSVGTGSLTPDEEARLAELLDPKAGREPRKPSG